MENLTEDQVIDMAGELLGLDKNAIKKIKNAKARVGQLTTFNQFGYKKKSDKPDGWYLPKDNNKVAFILETKSSEKNIADKKWVNELLKNCKIIEKGLNVKVNSICL